MFRNLRLKVAGLSFTALAAALVFAPTAQASIIRYNFTVDVTSGPLAGEVHHGSLSFDSSLAVPDALYGWPDPEPPLLSAFDFTFNGTTYTAATANTGMLGFDTDGSLAFFMVGNHCTMDEDLCHIHLGEDQWAMFAPGEGTFIYSPLVIGREPTMDDVGFGNVTMSVPEPGALSLFAVGVAVVGAVAWRRRRLA